MPLRHLLYSLVPLLFLSLPVNAAFRDYWSDDKIYDKSKSAEQQLKPTVFEPTDKIDIMVGEKIENGITTIENKAHVRVTVKLGIERITKLEISDVLLESVPGFAEDGTTFPARLALYKINPDADVRELTTSFENIRIMHLKGFEYSEMVLMVKVRTESGKHYYTVKRLKVYD